MKMTNKKNYDYVYGPVSSWRLGRSLGVDPISVTEKICSFDCVYCQLGRTKVLTEERRVFVPSEDVVSEIRSLPQLSIDYITFSGAGEPTLAENLGEMIKAVKKIRSEKTAVITNASLVNRNDVREDLFEADFILAKFDACSRDLFRKINRPTRNILFDAVVRGLKDFRSVYKGRFALQIMFTRANEKYARSMAEFVKEIQPDEIQINTPLRPCSVKSLHEAAVHEIASYFKEMGGDGVSVFNVFEGQKQEVAAISTVDTLRRRGKSSGQSND